MVWNKELIPRVMIIAERSYCLDGNDWVNRIQRFIGILEKSPSVALQIRNKQSEDDWNEIRNRVNSWHKTLPTQLYINGLHCPKVLCNRHFPEQTDFEHTLSLRNQQNIFGMSIHHSESLSKAYTLQIHYVQFGAVFPTAKPVIPTGIPRLNELCQRSQLPVLAVGGIDSLEKVRDCIAAGAHGVSIGRWLLNHPTPNRLLEEILHEFTGHTD